MKILTYYTVLHSIIQYTNSICMVYIKHCCTYKYTTKDIKVKVKVKCTLLQALRLCTGCTAHRGSSSIALPCHDHGTRRG